MSPGPARLDPGAKDFRMFKRILVPLDGSQLAEKILPLVEEEAIRSGSKVTLYHVITASRSMLPSSQPVIHGSQAMVDLFEPALAKAMEYLKRTGERLASKGIAVTWTVQRGSTVGECIAGYARDKEIDLIAIATHGRSWLGRLLSGSTTDYLLRKSGLPILALRPTESVGDLQSVRPYPAGA